MVAIGLRISIPELYQSYWNVLGPVHFHYLG